MERVIVNPKKYADYLPFMEDHVVNEIDYLIDKLKGKKVAMINATAFGGGVAEKLSSLIPLLQDMGLDVDWWTMAGSQEFYNITKTFHNRLQGQEGHPELHDIDIYLKYNKKNAVDMKDWEYDFIVIHDPQPAALIDYRQPDNSLWIWRCHIDTSTPNPEYRDFINKFTVKYDNLIFTMEEYAGESMDEHKITIIPPSIDPLSIKNVCLDIEEARKITAKFGVDDQRQLITQVSRFDPWKDPLGVIEVYKIIKREFPSVQLALVGSMAADDPEGWDYLYHTLRRAGEDYDIKVVTNFNGITNYEVNAFQTASDVLLQKSLREGFGLTVAEGLWKGKPVVGGNVGGIRMQIEDGVSGYLVDTVEDCAEKVLTLLRNPMLAQEMATAGREKVKSNFLITTNALHYLRLFNKLLQQ